MSKIKTLDLNNKPKKMALYRVGGSYQVFDKIEEWQSGVELFCHKYSLAVTKEEAGTIKYIELDDLDELFNQ